MILISWVWIFFWLYNRKDMITLKQYGHLTSSQSCEHDLISPLKNENTIVSKTKCDFKQAVSILHDPTMALVCDIQIRPL